MANEFGSLGAITSNVGSITGNVGSASRMSGKNLETTVGGAEWEAFYGGYWRDISSDYSYDTTKAGNTIARCIRWDDGFRSYRQDRGLIIRQKEKQQDADVDEFLGGIEDFASTFAKSFGVSAAISLGTETIKNTFKTTPVGIALGAAEIFGGLMLSRDEDRTTREKLLGTAMTLGAAVGVAALPVNPFIKAIAVPAAIFAKGLFTGHGIADSSGSVLGYLAGVALGRAAAVPAIEGFKLGSAPPPAKTITNIDPIIKPLGYSRFLAKQRGVQGVVDSIASQLKPLKTNNLLNQVSASNIQAAIPKRSEYVFSLAELLKRKRKL